jgi:hypothetical protein
MTVALPSIESSAQRFLAIAREMRRQASHHEAGHTLVAIALGCDVIEVTIGERGNAGTTSIKPPVAKRDLSAIAAGGLAAELVATNPNVTPAECVSQIDRMTVGDRALLSDDPAEQLADFAFALKCIQANPQVFDFLYQQLWSHGKVSPPPSEWKVRRSPAAVGARA